MVNMVQKNPGGCCTLMVDEEIPPNNYFLQLLPPDNYYTIFIYIYIYIYIYTQSICAFKSLIMINRIQNKTFCLHNMCVCTVYVYVYVYIYIYIYIHIYTHLYISEKYVYIKYIYIQYKLYAYKYRHVNTCKYCQIYPVCIVFILYILYIKIYTEHIYLYYVINCLTALNQSIYISNKYTVFYK